jgi:biopolymer transport protein ExbD
MSDHGTIYTIIRRRDFRRRELEGKPFDSSSIADLAFLLLIFFIVTSSFILRQGLFISYPSRNAGAVSKPADQVFELYPDNEGFLVEGARLDRAETAALLVKHRELHGADGAVNIIMNGDVRYERLVDAVSLVKEETGITAVGIRGGEDR